MNTSKTVLLVEDNALNAMSLRLELSDLGYRVLLAATGDRAIEVAKEHRPALLVVDINLAGDMDGIEAAHAILQAGPVPVLFISGYDDAEVRARAAACARGPYLLKPVTGADIHSAIAALGPAA